jgi:hypothetical protein
MTSVQNVAIPCLLVWLLTETIWDLKDRNIPRWFSIIPLMVGLIHLALDGNWLSAVLMTISILGTNIRGRWRYLVVGMPVLVLVFLPGILPLAIGWSLLYLAWELGWFGGADALAGAYLLVWFPEWEMAVCIVIGVLMWILMIAGILFGKQAGLHIWTRVSAGVRGIKTPGLGAFLVALLLFCLHVDIH